MAVDKKIIKEKCPIALSDNFLGHRDDKKLYKTLETLTIWGSYDNYLNQVILDFKFCWILWYLKIWLPKAERVNEPTIEPWTNSW